MEFSETELYRSVYYRYYCRAPKHVQDQLSFSSKAKGSKTAGISAVAEKKEVEPELDLETAIAQKRDLKQMKDAYDPDSVEKYWYNFWKQKKYFHADLAKAKQVPFNKRYTMVIPPPNVTSYLHIGHALFVAIEDALTRWHRMKGDVTCWLPGLDHAGIGTQSVVEKTLLKQGLNKNQLGREKFLEKVWDWKNKHGDLILNQFERLGASVDWDRFAFTMDPKLNKGVSEAFIRLFDRGLIYRSYRLVNWSCKLQTALSDIEVEYQEIEEPKMIKVPGHDCEAEFGVLIQFAYKVKGSDKEIIVATTRIETMLGDTAVAVHSSDERYKDLQGKELIHPFNPNRVIKVIVDDELVDPTFGTGAVKVTPGHDFRDCQCGLRNKLEFVNILNDDGTINENGGQYSGLKRYECRNKIIKDLEALGLIRGKLKNPMRLGFCSRSGDIIEPLLRPQWYVDTKPVKERMLNCVKTRELKIIPEIFEQEWFKWIDDLRDWCISRQLWWGHRVPAWLVTIKDLNISPDMTDEKHWVAAHSEEQALEKAASKYGVDKSKIQVRQDEDVLDTWFSSGLFPFTPFGWPDDENGELDSFYPGHVLETGHDILFFWVAKMVMMGFYLTDKLPFNTVYLHNLVRDKDGEKMSKSKGNVVDPLDVINGATLEKLIERLKDSNLSADDLKYHIQRRKEDYPSGIPPCGTDSLRYALISGCIQSRYMNLDVKRIISDRLFVNKIWQSFKFMTSKLAPDFKYNPSLIEADKLSLCDKWILSRLERIIALMTANFENYKFGELALDFTAFWYEEVCDTYIEAVKPAFNPGNDSTRTQNVLFTVLEQSLRLLHPLMPFISEELYQKLPSWENKSESICIAPYPTSNGWNLDQEAVSYAFNLCDGIAKTARQLAASVNLPNSAKPEFYCLVLSAATDAKKVTEIIEANKELILTLGRGAKLTIVQKKEEIGAGCIMGVSMSILEVHINVKDHIDIKKEIERLQKKIDQNNGFIENLKKKTSAPGYETKVPEKVRLENQEKLNGYNIDNAKLAEALENFKKYL